MKGLNLQSYVGGQILMLAQNHRHRQPGKKNPKQVWRRGEINSIQLRNSTITVDLDWIAIKRGGTYFEIDDSSFLTVDIEIESLGKGTEYTLVVGYKDDDGLEIVFCFAEPDSKKIIPRSKIRPLSH